MPLKLSLVTGYSGDKEGSFNTYLVVIFIIIELKSDMQV
jgi:hypothetical protein